MAHPKYKRRRKLIKPRLQLKLTLTFVGLSALSLLLQFVLFQNTLTRAAVDLPNDSVLLMEASNMLLLRDVAISFLVFLPLTFLVGILTTFRIAGPVYRFEQFLQDVRSGRRPPSFRLRRGDELQDLAELLNVATAPLREDEPSPDSTGDVLDVDDADSIVVAVQTTSEADAEQVGDEERSPDREQA